MVTRHIQGVKSCLDEVKARDQDGQEATASGGARMAAARQRCYTPSTLKLMKEVLLSEQLQHPNIARLLGYCVRSEESDSTDIAEHGVVSVYELGTRFVVDSLQILPWPQRLRHALQLADLLHYLHHSPLGSLVIPDFKEGHFVLANASLKLIDLDDINNIEPSCGAALKGPRRPLPALGDTAGRGVRDPAEADWRSTGENVLGRVSQHRGSSDTDGGGTLAERSGSRGHDSNRKAGKRRKRDSTPFLPHPLFQPSSNGRGDAPWSPQTGSAGYVGRQWLSNPESTSSKRNGVPPSIRYEYERNVYSNDNNGETNYVPLHPHNDKNDSKINLLNEKKKLQMAQLHANHSTNVNTFSENGVAKHSDANSQYHFRFRGAQSQRTLLSGPEPAESPDCSYSLQCTRALCLGFNAKENLKNMNRLLFKRLLFPLTFPQEVVLEIGQLNARLDTLDLSAEQLRTQLFSIEQRAHESSISR